MLTQEQLESLIVDEDLSPFVSAALTKDESGQWVISNTVLYAILTGRGIRVPPNASVLSMLQTFSRAIRMGTYGTAASARQFIVHLRASFSNLFSQASTEEAERWLELPSFDETLVSEEFDEFVGAGRSSAIERPSIYNRFGNDIDFGITTEEHGIAPLGPAEDGIDPPPLDDDLLVADGPVQIEEAVDNELTALLGDDLETIDLGATEVITADTSALETGTSLATEVSSSLARTGVGLGVGIGLYFGIRGIVRAINDDEWESYDNAVSKAWKIQRDFYSRYFRREIKDTDFIKARERSEMGDLFSHIGDQESFDKAVFGSMYTADPLINRHRQEQVIADSLFLKKWLDVVKTSIAQVQKHYINKLSTINQADPIGTAKDLFRVEGDSTSGIVPRLKALVKRYNNGTPSAEDYNLIYTANAQEYWTKDVHHYQEQKQDLFDAWHRSHIEGKDDFIVAPGAYISTGNEEETISNEEQFLRQLYSDPYITQGLRLDVKETMRELEMQVPDEDDESVMIQPGTGSIGDIDWLQAYKCVVLSADAYETEPNSFIGSDVEFSAVEEFDTIVQDGLQTLGSIANIFSAGFASVYGLTDMRQNNRFGVILTKNDGYIYIKGSSTLLNWFHNVTSSFTGDHYAYKKIAGYIAHIITERYGALFSKQNIYLAGHSMGGGVATALLLQMLTENPLLATKLRLYTFGAPRTLSQDSMTFLASHGVQAFNFLNELDPIRLVVPTYDMYGIKAVLTGESKVVVYKATDHPPFTNSAPYEFARMSLEMYSDHGIQNYIDRIKLFAGLLKKLPSYDLDTDTHESDHIESILPAFGGSRDVSIRRFVDTATLYEIIRHMLESSFHRNMKIVGVVPIPTDMVRDPTSFMGVIKVL